MSEFESIQPTDDREAELAVTGKIRKKIREHRREKDLAAEAHLRQLISVADDALAGERAIAAERVLMEIHYCLRVDERLPEVLHPTDERLDARDKVRFIKHSRLRNEGEHPPPMQEYTTAVKLGRALGYFASYSDKTRYAPVRLAPLPTSSVDTLSEVTPIGRIRVGKSESAELEDKAIDIDHSSAEHFLIEALPRKGKDSTGCRIIGNLVDEHNYKAFSIFDDGRNETNMWGVPADEKPIKKILRRDFNQQPKAYPTRVYVPATNGLPEELPANFEPFTIGIGDLTPEILKRLASVTAGGADTERRLGIALRDTLNQEGTVEALIERIHEFADETEAQITVTEVLDDEQREEQSTASETVSYTMAEDKVLLEIAKALTMLAGDGLLGDVGEESNLDMVSEFKAQERIAVLNCNYLEGHNQYLKYVLCNVWLNLIWELRDDDTLRIPRAVLELRELKNLAPSVKSRARYSGIVNSITQTLHEIASQGGSRRVLMIGSTQKLNGVNKAIRQNMPNKIMLQSGEEEIGILDSAMNLSFDQRQRLKRFQPGWGMLSYDGDLRYPIQWCPARNGMGLGDYNWRDRYARASGARVLEFHQLPDSAEVWIDMEGGVHSAETLQEGEWYLLPEDIPEAESLQVGEQLQEERVEAALQERREFELPQEIGLQETELSDTQRQIILRNAEDSEADVWEEVRERYDIPVALSRWKEFRDKKRENMVDVLTALAADDIKTQGELSGRVGLSNATVSNYITDDSALGSCVEGTSKGDVMELTPVGISALQIPWSELPI